MDSFKTVLIKDAVIGDMTPELEYGIQQGAAQKTYQQFVATSPSNSALIFNIQVPSENVVVGRDVLIQTGLTFTITVPSTLAPDVDDVCPQWGNSLALQAFPLASIMNTATAQINNTTVSANLIDILPQLLRMNNTRELLRYNSMTPSLPDMAYANYSDGLGANNSPLEPYGTCSFDVDQVSRGSFPCVVQYNQFTAGGGYVSSSPIVATAGNYFQVVVQTIVTEPLFLSPFTWGNPEFNAQGLLGINNMNFTFNIDSNLKRLVSSGAFSAGGSSMSIAAGGSLYAGGVVTQTTANLFTTLGVVGTQSALSNPLMLFKFLSTQPSDLLQTKNVCPYLDTPRYLTSTQASAPLASGSSTSIQSANLQINQIPDSFLIVARKPMNSQNMGDSATFLKINSISINFNNQSGLLSSATPQDLWKMSSKNGCNQSWLEWGGVAFASNDLGTLNGPVATTGSLLVINPAYDLSLPSYLSCGSLGNYNLQFTLNVTNQTNQSFAPEIVIIALNSGIFMTQQGVSSVYTGILTKEMVESTSRRHEAGYVSSIEAERMVGGSMLNRMSMRKHHGHLHKSKHHAMSGGATSGGAISGGAISGGRRHKLHSLM